MVQAGGHVLWILDYTDVDNSGCLCPQCSNIVCYVKTKNKNKNFMLHSKWIGIISGISGLKPRSLELKGRYWTTLTYQLTCCWPQAKNAFIFTTNVLKSTVFMKPTLTKYNKPFEIKHLKYSKCLMICLIYVQKPYTWNRSIKTQTLFTRQNWTWWQGQMSSTNNSFTLFLLQSTG